MDSVQKPPPPVNYLLYPTRKKRGPVLLRGWKPVTTRRAGGSSEGHEYSNLLSSCNRMGGIESGDDGLLHVRRRRGFSIFQSRNEQRGEIEGLAACNNTSMKFVAVKHCRWITQPLSGLPTMIDFSSPFAALYFYTLTTWIIKCIFLNLSLHRRFLVSSFGVICRQVERLANTFPTDDWNAIWRKHTADATCTTTMSVKEKLESSFFFFFLAPHFVLMSSVKWVKRSGRAEQEDGNFQGSRSESGGDPASDCTRYENCNKQWNLIGFNARRNATATKWNSRNSTKGENDSIHIPVPPLGAR